MGQVEFCISHFREFSRSNFSKYSSHNFTSVFGKPLTSRILSGLAIGPITLVTCALNSSI